jgi:DNA-binding transcriptional regulator YhcF (GntR family)
MRLSERVKITDNRPRRTVISDFTELTSLQMIRLWLSKNSAANLRDQLATQLMLGVTSGDLKAGEKLPSVRELARRYHIHPNTVSAAYRDLETSGWAAFKKGSGIYVRDLRPAEVDPTLDRLIESFLVQARAHGFSTAEVRARVSGFLAADPVRRLVVVEPEPELGEILVAELRERVSLPVTCLPAARLSGAAVTALVSRTTQVRADLPPGIPHHFLRLRSVPEYLQGQPRPQTDAPIAVASSSPEILRRTRTILAAASLDPEALEFRDAREDGWKNGLASFQFVITDVVTAPRIPGKCVKRVFRVLSDASIDELRAFLQLVTDQKVS